MRYAIEMSSSAMIYIPSTIRTGLGIQKLVVEEGFRDTQNGDLINLLFIISK
jgi:hypothetical protein